MRGLFDTLEIVVQIALRNLLANRWKTLIVGGIIAFGALLVVVGTSLLDAVDHAMSRSIVGSVAGNIQVYSSESKDELAVMGGFNADAADIAPITDFAKVRATLRKVPNVKAVIPMGIAGALVTSGNSVDTVLAHLRESAQHIVDGDRSPDTLRRYQSQKGHVRQIVDVLQHDLENVRRVNSERVFGNEELESVHHAASQGFWSSFDADPLEHLEFLENRIASLATDADMLFLRYVGTDPTEFKKHFDRMSIVDGQGIPAGQRGFLLSKYVYEEQIKLKAARGLDKIKEARDVRHLEIATDLDLQRIVRENTTGVRELLLQLDAIKSDEFRTKLQRFLGSSQVELGALLSQFFKTDDRNFDARYHFFYKELAPQLELYRIRIGDMLTIKAFTRSGYVQSANLKVYGTYAFRGLERSPQAGSLNMMDLVSFRELYGFMTDERAREIESMRASAGAKEIDRDKAEAELFGSAQTDSDAAGKDGAATPSDAAPEDVLAGLKGTARRDQQASRYDPAQLEQGVVLNVAVLLRDEAELDQTMAAIERAGKQNHLPLKAISWQQAAGIVGQFATLMRAVLYATVVIIFVVALVVINNALVMATLERVHEFGTLRAIGAQRRFVLAMLVVESLVVGLLSGTFGALLGTGVLFVLSKRGIPAINDIFTFFFSGPRLYPSIGAPALLFALSAVLIVSIVSGFYPAWIAMRVSPREAMSTEE
jgi:ABC-type lipoprotein release transport system permease subunit